MCSRYLFARGREAVAKALKVKALAEAKPHFNAAPSQDLPVIRRDDQGELFASELQWGLVPSWSRDPKGSAPLRHARGETAAEKPSFREAFKRRRCLVPADGFYEWKAVDSARLPFLFERADQQPMLFAGLWESWRGEGGEPIDSFAIVTTEANPLVGELIDRMPVILEGEAVQEWLAPERAREALQALITPFPATAMTRRAVHPRMNNSKYDAPDCLDDPPIEAPRPEQLGLGF